MGLTQRRNWIAVQETGTRIRRILLHRDPNPFCGKHAAGSFTGGQMTHTHTNTRTHSHTRTHTQTLLICCSIDHPSSMFFISLNGTLPVFIAMCFILLQKEKKYRGRQWSSIPQRV